MKSRVEEIVERLPQAFKSKKGVEKTFAEVIINKNLENSLLVAKRYGKKSKNTLYEDIKAKLCGCFKELCDYCFLTPIEFNPKMLKRGLKGLSIDVVAILEILVSNKLDECKQINEAYRTDTRFFNSGRVLGRRLDESLCILFTS